MRLYYAQSILQTSVSLLIKKGILTKNNDTYEITDVFFKEWIRLTLYCIVCFFHLIFKKITMLTLDNQNTSE